MNLPLPKGALLPDSEQPVESWEECGEFGFRTIVLARAGIAIEQHVHDDTHATLVCSGRARGWKDGEYMGEKGPGEAFLVEGGMKHWFEAAEPMTRLSCVTHLPSMKKGG